MLNVFWEDATKGKLKYEKGGYEDTELFTWNKSRRPSSLTLNV